MYTKEEVRSKISWFLSNIPPDWVIKGWANPRDEVIIIGEVEVMRDGYRDVLQINQIVWKASPFFKRLRVGRKDIVIGITDKLNKSGAKL